MLNSYINPSEIRQQLTKTYQQLPSTQKKMVQLFSIIYAPISRSSFVLCLRSLEIRDDRNAYFTLTTLQPYYDKFTKLNLITQGQIDKSPQCNPLLAEIATRDAIKEGWFNDVVKTLKTQLTPKDKYTLYRGQNSAYFLQLFRIHLYLGDVDGMLDEYDRYYQYNGGHPSLSWSDVVLTIGNNPFDGEWLKNQPLKLYEEIISGIIFESENKLIPAGDAFQVFLDECLEGGKNQSDYLLMLLSQQLLLQGNWDILDNYLDRISSEHQQDKKLYLAWRYFVTGDNDKSIELYADAYKTYQKLSRKKKIYFNTVSGIFYIFALIKDSSSQNLQKAKEYVNIVANEDQSWLQDIYKYLRSLLDFLSGDLRQKQVILSRGILYYKDKGNTPLKTLISCLCHYWVDEKTAKTTLTKYVLPLFKDAQNSGYYWIAKEAYLLLNTLQPNKKLDIKPEVLKLSQDLGIPTLSGLIHAPEEWELTLKALMELQPHDTSATATIKEKRLAWFLQLGNYGLKIQPKEQSINKTGAWGKGRNIALKRLTKTPEEFDYITSQDMKVCQNIDGTPYYGGIEYEIRERAIVDLIGHPLVFWEDQPNIPIEIVKGEPELLVKRSSSNQITLQLNPSLETLRDVIFMKETPTRLKVIYIQSQHKRIQEIIGSKNKLTLPAKAESKILEAIGRISNLVTIHSDIGGEVENIPEVPSHAIPHIHLLPVAEGLRVALLCRPFGDEGIYYTPGNGGERVIAEIKGERLQTKRDLSLEKKLAQDVIKQCPTLILYSGEQGEWLIENPEECLELLLELQALDDQVIVEWPQGQKFKVTHQANFDSLRLQIRGQKDWFSVEGELQLDENSVLELQQLLELLDESPSRFIALSDGEFIALTHEFRQRLEELKAFSEKQGKGRRFHPLASLAMEEFIDELGQVKVDRNWENHRQKLKEMRDFEPQIPSTLQAELRDYQIDGFNWLARLSYWGVGACLADDMGLGKTLQALAVILTRANQGASLIIAPTSVCFNWESEAGKFAPTLNPIMFGTGDRQETLNQLQPFDLVICTYGLLQQEEVAEMLAQVQWQTIVLDEAQAIKNITTKRSQGAMKLQAEFKLITTGTPIENHLGELWNLFRFINPGLLGTMEKFNERFANAIERNKDKNARQQLKKLIQPFLLRRTKSQVLTELPPRTEITLAVELSKEEMAFYEALRRDAIAKLENNDAQAGAKHLQVLAEIMRLRRACCHPSLVKGDYGLKSTKLEAFGEIVTELLENRHKALVFSQFVDHLHIIREYLDRQNITYQYLDGSTPVKERQKRVNAFQSGEGDIFLISLKAGGTGLNLTAADYVIHMDPWWNPAVEDQASDRAHRIGQKRPVTIYRLVAKNTIEEKIVDLHSQKRDLADSLLEGSEVSGKISTDQLLGLISEV
ncbi:DEAD/DEAH box helicase [Geminocystis herdmanii]|uniref:DEAD/DEAH box helicase n=1 Tax=Geminocystis herdmanii TaxID=669359 RepID=UPI00034DB396|nr:DEAD/DEAH box helicase [Geminocystis herdmanii]